VRRADVRKSGTKKLPEITNNYGLQIDLSMFLGCKEKATGPWMIAYPQVEDRGSPHWHSAIQSLRNARTSQDCGSSTAQSP